MGWLSRLKHMLNPQPPLRYGVANLPHHTERSDHISIPPYTPVELPPIQLQDEIRKRIAEAHEERMMMFEFLDEIAATHIYDEEAVQKMVEATHPENAIPPWEDDDE